MIFFPLTFWPAACRDGGRGGGVPPSRHKAVIGVFERFPNYVEIKFTFGRNNWNFEMNKVTRVFFDDFCLVPIMSALVLVS